MASQDPFSLGDAVHVTMRPDDGSTTGVNAIVSCEADSERTLVAVPEPFLGSIALEVLDGTIGLVHVKSSALSAGHQSPWTSPRFARRVLTAARLLDGGHIPESSAKGSSPSPRALLWR